MVFQSLPLYVDPPNWPQQPNQQPTGGAGADQNSQLPPRPPPAPGGPASAGSIKPGSMAERARLAKIPQPESALKCPRCDSTNTKFCYFNNYSLSQPRHFCKTCRRYWTRGGALRNVPVGGGCRRNKRSKANHRSKSPVLLKTAPAGVNVPSSDLTSDSCTTGDVLHLPPSTQLPILPPLHHLGDFNSADIGLNFCGIQPPAAAVCGGGIEFPTSSSGGGFLEQWKLQQFPLISNLDTTTGLYPLEGGGVENSTYIGQLRWAKPGNGEGNQLKMEGNSNIQGLNLSRNLLGSLAGSNDHQYWSNSSINAWTDQPGFTSSSASHLM